MAQVELTGTTWIYPDLVAANTDATFDMELTLDTTVDLHLGPGTVTIGMDPYTIAFTEGDLRVDTIDDADPFEPFHLQGLRATRVVTVSLTNSDGSPFTSGGGIFSWSREELTTDAGTMTDIIQILDLGFIHNGQIYTMVIFSSSQPSSIPATTPALSWATNQRQGPQARRTLSPLALRFIRQLNP